MRLPRLSSVAFFFSIIKERYFLTDQQRKYRNYFAAKNVCRENQPASPVIVLQCVENIGYFGLFGCIITKLRQIASVHSVIIIPRSLRHGSWRSPRHLFWEALISNHLTDYVWQRLYFSFCDGVAYRSVSWMMPWDELRILVKAFRIWRNLKSKDALADLTIKGIRIGDLIIDSYLRFRPTPEIELNDFYLVMVIRQALKDIEKALRYFSNVKPDLYLTTYTTYVQHGVAARVAATCGVRVLSFGNFQDFCKEIMVEDPYQVKASADYATAFTHLPQQFEKIAAADKVLAARVTGQIDTPTAYMKTSAWQGDAEIPTEVRGSPVIFLHDFYDSGHLYPHVLFHDFWEWTCFTIEALERHRVPFFIKPHPNQIGASDNAFRELRQKYPNLRILPQEINNRQLAEGGIVAVVTVFGTISSEMAFLGIPTISCGDNPHASFPFCRVARSRVEYEALLQDFSSVQGDREEMRKQACSFFYMHNLNLTDDALDLRDRSIKLRTNIWYNPQSTIESILDDFQEFESAESLKAFCEKLTYDLASGRR